MLGNIISNGYENMSVFCDTTIRKYIWTIFGYKGITLDQIQPCSVDLRLDKKLKKITGETYNLEDEPYILQPNEFILGSTVETVDIPNNILARVEGRSSLGRLGIMIHVTAGFIDPGFLGNITLEIKNVSDQPFELNYLDRICQIVFEWLDDSCLYPYDGKYQGDKGVQTSRWKE